MIPRITIDGQDWVLATAYDKAVADLAEKQRSQASHNHAFAAIKDCFDSLPTSHAQAPYAASADAFRKHGLIVTGHCDTDTLAMPSADAAKQAAPIIAKLARKAHGYALTVVRGQLIVCSTPHSQSFKAMGKERFEQSKADVLNWAMGMVGR